MWIQVRSMDGKSSTRVDGLSKLTKIEDLRTKLIEPFNATEDRQRLFYRGKQLENGYTLFDYNVGLNDIIQILVKPMCGEISRTISKIEDNMIDNHVDDDSLDKENTPVPAEELEFLLSQNTYFRVGDQVDAKDGDYGAWFEAKITDIKITSSSVINEFNTNGHSTVKVMQNISNGTSTEEHNGYKADMQNLVQYSVVFESYQDDDPVILPLSDIRPRAKKILKFQDLKEGDMVMVNYNVDDPKSRGFWFDCKITGKKSSRTVKELIGTVFIGKDASMENCNIRFVDEVFAIEKRVLLSEEKSREPADSSVQRETMPKCSHCRDIPTRKCKHCSCHTCGGKNDPGKQILCDECDLPFHIWCLDPPLTAIPDDDEWYCPLCKNDETEVVKAGEKLKESKKKAKMASATCTSRDWGKGMACVGRTKECTIVPPNHFGPVPGVEVGMLWKFRVQVSETGAHRPHVAGIHGRESDGAYSIVLSGGYEDDLDEGNEFKYTGSGGRDLSGNKRTAEQSCDQTLTRMNKALAMNCAAKIDSKNGAEAQNWKDGKPVRVIRNCKGRKHSKYSPEEGNRYDGIYKIVKYWPEKGKSGHLVWRYLLRRDDPTPAPWTKAGQKRISELGFTMKYPEGYLEHKAELEKTDGKEKKSKRSNSDADSPIQKKKRKSSYRLPKKEQDLISLDTANSKLWEECFKHVEEGNAAFLREVENQFSCICCQELVLEPVTTDCSHNICKPCLQRSFKAEVYCCPMCRYELGKGYVISVNGALKKVLCTLFPGYDAGR